MKNLPNFEVEMMLSALDDLLDMKILFRKIVPSYILDEESNQIFLSILRSLHQKIQPLFQKYLNQNVPDEMKVQNYQEILDQIKQKSSIVLVSANSSKNVLKKIGLDPQNIIVSGGPLIYEDYKELNPSLSDQALLGIQRKCQNLLRLLQSNRFKEKELFFIYVPQNATDKIILNEISNNNELIGRKIKIYKISSWKDFELNQASQF